MLILKPLSLGILSRVAYLRRRHIFALGAVAPFRLDDPTRLTFEPAFWKAAAPLLNGAILDQAMPKPQGEVLLLGTAHAPQGQPVRVMDVGFRIGPITRRLRVFGNRHWVEARGGIYPTEAAPFTEMPITAARAFGGANYPENPAGHGHGAAALLRAGAPAALPNIEDADRPLREIGDAPPPVLTGPVDIAAPSRRRMAGTYDSNYLRDWHPGLPPDADMRLFQAAQPNQWLQGFFSGEEEIILAGFRQNPEPWRSRLPGMRVRSFVQQRNAEGVISAHEIAMRIDTVWLLPDAGLGCLIYRGLHPVTDPDGKDIATVMMGYERLSDPPRAVEHYQEQLRLRTDEATKAHYLLRESPLKPERTKEEIARREAARKRKRAEIVAKSALAQEVILKQMERQAGLQPGALPRSPPPELPDFPIVTEEDIEELDIDLGEIWEFADKQFADLESKAEAVRSGGPAALLGVEGLDHLLAAAENRDAPLTEAPPEMLEAAAEIRAARDVDALLARALPEDAPDEIRAEAREKITTALSRPAPDRESVWLDLEARLRRDVSRHPAVKAFNDMELPDLSVLDDPAAILPADGTSETDAAREAIRARRSEGGKPSIPDLDALLSGAEFGDAPAGATPITEKLDEAKKKISEGLGKSFPDLAHLPPGEAIKAITERFTPAGISHAPPTKAEVEAKLAEAKKQIEDIASGAAFADLRRLSPAPTPEEFSWDPAFAERLGALIKELSANSEGLAGRDFAGVKMPGLALPGVDLTESFWERAELPGANFTNSTMNGAVFTAADLTAADLSGANLEGANFSSAKLDQARFRRARFADGMWMEINGTAVDMSGASLAKAMIIKCRLPGISFAGGEILDNIFMECDFSGADFSGAVMERCIFMKCDLTHLRAAKVRMDTCAFVDCPMEGADFRDAHLDNFAVLLGQLLNARFRRAQGRNVTLHAANLAGADFAGANLPKVTLSEAKLTGTSFLRARLRHASMGAMEADGADFTGADLFQAQLRRALLTRANFFGTNLAQADMDGVDIVQADFTGANLMNTILDRESKVLA